MARLPEQGYYIRRFSQGAAVQHRYPVAHVGDNAQVVGNQQDGGAQFPAEPLEPLQNFRLQGNIQPGGGFIGNQQAGAHYQGDSQHYPLAHSAAEVEGIFP